MGSKTTRNIILSSRNTVHSTHILWDSWLWRGRYRQAQNTQCGKMKSLTGLRGWTLDTLFSSFYCILYINVSNRTSVSSAVPPVLLWPPFVFVVEREVDNGHTFFSTLDANTRGPHPSGARFENPLQRPRLKTRVSIGELGSLLFSTNPYHSSFELVLVVCRKGIVIFRNTTQSYQTVRPNASFVSNTILCQK
jgi:hypothetical protein